MRELEVEILRFFTGLQQPVLDLFAWVLTFLGDETFYFIIIPFVYWCISKPFGIRLLYVFLISVYINASLKALTSVTRPVGIEGLNINALYVQSAEVGTHFPHDSFPSGHAQGSATLWGFIAYKLNRPKVWIAAGILVFLISIARLYTGVHWPTDLIVGVLIAAVIIAIYHVMEKRITALSEKTRLVLAVLVPVLMVILFTDSEGFSYGGFLLGAGIGFFLEKWYVGMVIPSRWSKRIIAYVIGVIGIFALQTGLKVLFPEGEVFDGLRYFIIGLFGIWIAPILFVKLGLYKKQ